MVAKINEIEPLFYETPAMKDPSWKLINCKDRQMFTRHSVHGFHYLLAVYRQKFSSECKKELRVRELRR
jgi:hypothetical protein